MAWYHWTNILWDFVFCIETSMIQHPNLSSTGISRKTTDHIGVRAAWFDKACAPHSSLENSQTLCG